MLAKRSAIASLNSDFYRQQYHKLLRWLMALVFIMFLLMAAVIDVILFQPTRPYYGNTLDGMILPMPKPMQNQTTMR